MINSLRKKIVAKMAKGITHTFTYDGYSENHMEPNHAGTVVDLGVQLIKIDAEIKNQWWSHHYPAHSMSACTKVGLWDQVKAYAHDRADKPVIEVKDLAGCVAVINL